MIAPIGSLASPQGLLTEPVSQGAGTQEVAASTGASEAPATGSPSSVATSGEGSFSNALGQALNSLESSQAAGETAAAQVATGKTSNPEGAVVKVMNAELEMQLASQIRSKASEALETIFQTQV